jgi:hypothetical protein
MAKCFEADRGEITSTRTTLSSGNTYLVSQVDNGKIVIITHDDTAAIQSWYTSADGVAAYKSAFEFGRAQGIKQCLGVVLLFVLVCTMLAIVFNLHVSRRPR